MTIMNLVALFGLDKDEMAKRAPINEELVNQYVVRLKGARTDRTAFDSAFSDLKCDRRLKAGDVVVIAQSYAGGGKKPSSKAMALAAISKRFVEIVRFHAKNKVAEKARPW